MLYLVTSRRELAVPTAALHLDRTVSHKQVRAVEWCASEWCFFFGVTRTPLEQLLHFCPCVFWRARVALHIAGQIARPTLSGYHALVSRIHSSRILCYAMVEIYMRLQ